MALTEKQANVILSSYGQDITKLTPKEKAVILGSYGQEYIPSVTPASVASTVKKSIVGDTEYTPSAIGENIVSGAVEGSGAAGASRLTSAAASLIGGGELNPYKKMVTDDMSMGEKFTTVAPAVAMDIADTALIPIMGLKGAVEGALTGSVLKSTGIERGIENIIKSTGKIPKYTPVGAALTQGEKMFRQFQIDNLKTTIEKTTDKVEKNKLRTELARLQATQNIPIIEPILSNVTETAWSVLPIALGLKGAQSKALNKMSKSKEYELKQTPEEMMEFAPASKTMQEIAEVAKKADINEVLDTFNTRIERKITDTLLSSSDVYASFKSKVSDVLNELPRSQRVKYNEIAATKGQIAALDAIGKRDEVLRSVSKPIERGGRRAEADIQGEDAPTMEFNAIQDTLNIGDVLDGSTVAGKFSMPGFKSTMRNLIKKLDDTDAESWGNPNVQHGEIEASNWRVDNPNTARMEKIYDFVHTVPESTRALKDTMLPDVVKIVSLATVSLPAATSFAAKRFIPAVRKVAGSPATLETAMELGVGLPKTSAAIMPRLARQLGYRAASMSEEGDKESVARDMVTQLVLDGKEDLFKWLDDLYKRSQSDKK
jgi:O6-methylguanine-DNA--protein-cysteine methyltransferase